MSTTFHIRAPKPRKGAANRFYESDEYRTQKTLCGAPVTSHDNSFRWQVEAVGSFEPCEECLLIRKEMRSKR
ncbi:MAG: hypothetical protein KGL35_19095 [Bradyrhizobium sp.]|nr:hypothetical protein [Bradyrhizobium sp.]